MVFIANGAWRRSHPRRLPIEFPRFYGDAGSVPVVNFARRKQKKEYLPGMTVGEIMRKFMQAAPVPWPKRVTLPGSPPKRAIFCWIQWSAAIWSIKPKLATRALTCGAMLALRKPANTQTEKKIDQISIFGRAAFARTEHAEPVIEGDHDHVRVAGQHRAVVRAARVPLERLAVDVDHHRVALHHLGRTHRCKNTYQNRLAILLSLTHARSRAQEFQFCAHQKGPKVRWQLAAAAILSRRHIGFHLKSELTAGFKCHVRMRAPGSFHLTFHALFPRSLATAEEKLILPSCYEVFCVQKSIA